MRPPTHVPRIRDYLRMLRDGWLVILCATALSGVAGWINWQTAGPVNQASTKVLVITPGAATTPDAYSGQLNSLTWSSSYQLLARSSWVTTRTIDQLGLAETSGELAARISVPPTTSAVLDVVVAGEDPVETREIANAVTANLIQLSKEMAAVDTAGSELVLADKAGSAQRQGSLRPFIIRAAVLGLAIAVLLVLAHGLLRDTLLGRGQVGRVVGEAVAEGNK